MFKLHPKLEEDCFHIGDFPLCHLLMMNDRNYPWFILVPRIADISEIYQLSSTEQAQLTVESSLLSETLMAMFDGYKMNTAALGNVVSQLHVHHLVRYENDPAWPDPVWGKAAAVPHYIDEADQIKQALRSAFPAELALK